LFLVSIVGAMHFLLLNIYMILELKRRIK